MPRVNVILPLTVVIGAGLTLGALAWQNYALRKKLTQQQKTK